MTDDVKKQREKEAQDEVERQKQQSEEQSEQAKQKMEKTKETFQSFKDQKSGEICISQHNLAVKNIRLHSNHMI